MNRKMASAFCSHFNITETLTKMARLYSATISTACDYEKIFRSTGATDPISIFVCAEGALGF